MLQPPHVIWFSLTTIYLVTSGVPFYYEILLDVYFQPEMR